MNRCRLLLSLALLIGPIVGAHAASPPAQPGAELPGMPLTLRSGVTELAASLLVPDAQPRAGVVLVPGSGPAVRAQLVAAAEQLVEAGLAALIFDKRGSGESGGDWRTASLDDLATDASVALQALREHAGVDAAGFWAHSQGNWVATRAIELGAEPAWFVAVSGGGAAPRAVERHGYRLRVAGFSDGERRRALALVDVYFDYLAGNLARDELDQRITRVAATPWYEPLGLARVLVSESGRSHWAWVANYDPQVAAVARGLPTLVLLGGDDESIPLETTVARWAAQLEAAPSRIVVLPGRDHHLQRGGPGHGLTTDDEVWSLIGAWIALVIE